MTTPAPAPVVTVTTDKASYNVGDAIQVTVEYPAGGTAGTTLSVTASVAIPGQAPVTATVEVQVGAEPGQADQVTVTDSFGGAYTQVSSAPGTAVFTGTIPPVPPGA